MTITHLGKTLNTEIHEVLTDSQYSELKEQILALPDFTDVEKQLKALHNGKVKINHIVGYYFKHLMYEGRNAHSKWSVMEALESKEIMDTKSQDTTQQLSNSNNRVLLLLGS